MYKVAIPSYKRADALLKKSLLTLSNGRVNSSRIYIFVANEEEQQIYETIKIINENDGKKKLTEIKNKDIRLSTFSNDDKELIIKSKNYKFE